MHLETSTSTLNQKHIFVIKQKAQFIYKILSQRNTSLTISVWTWLKADFLLQMFIYDHQLRVLKM